MDLRGRGGSPQLAVVMVVRWFGVERLRAVTLVPMALCLFFSAWA